MHHETAGEVDHPEVVEPPGRVPDPHRDRGVDEGRPEDDEDQQPLQPHPTGERADDERRRDRGELQLEGEVEERRDGRRISRVGRRPDVEEADIGERADHSPVAGAEGEGVSPECPDKADDREDHQALDERGDEVLPADEAAVEEPERGRHDHDERRGRDHPGRIAGVDRHHLLPVNVETGGRGASRAGWGREQRMPEGFPTEVPAAFCQINPPIQGWSFGRRADGKRAHAGPSPARLYAGGPGELSPDSGQRGPTKPDSLHDLRSRAA